MRYLESQSTDPYYNLALEEFVFEQLPKDDSYFMLWQNADTIVIGKYQNALEEVNQEYVDQAGIRVARRLSGGGAVFHDMGNLNFTFIVDQGDLEKINFTKFVLPIIETLEDFGVNAEFTGRNDLVIDGRVGQALNVRAAKFQSKNVQSVRSRVTTINAQAPEPITMDRFKTALKEHILGSGDVTPYELTPQDQEQIHKLREEKYATWDWNYGRSKAFDMIREEKFPAGLVTVHMTAQNGHIREIDISGDFFGNGEIGEFCEKLVGLPLDESLADRIESLDLDHYMTGIRPEELAGLIRG